MQMYGINWLGAIVQLLASLGFSTIGRWKIWCGSFRDYKGRGCIGKRKIGLFRRSVRAVSFLSKPSTLSWSQGSSVSFLVGVINSCVLMKVGFRAWEATWGKILTLDQLRRGGDVFFVITRKNSLITSLFIVLRQECYGSCCFSFFSLPWVLSSSVKETFLGWHDLFVSKKPKKKRGEQLPYAFFG